MAVPPIIDAAEYEAVQASVDAPASGGGDAGVAIEMAQVTGRLTGNTRIVVINNIAGAFNEPLSAAVQKSGGTYLVGLRPGLAALARWTPPCPDPIPSTLTVGVSDPLMSACPGPKVPGC
jgi:hypothetical protein